MIWNIYITNAHDFRNARILGGFFAGMVEALGPTIIADCFPEKHLASAMVTYMMSLGLGTAFGPLIAGVVAHVTGTWPWFFKFLAIITGINLLGTIIMLPETYHDHSMDPTSESEPGNSIQGIASHEETVHESKGSELANPRMEHKEDALPRGSASGSGTPGDSSLFQIWLWQSFYLKRPKGAPAPTLLRSPLLWFIVEPFLLLLAPAVFVTGIINGVLIAFVVTASVVLAAFLQSPPALWSALSFSLLNLSSLVGIVLGIPIGGLIADVLSRRSAKKNDGFHIRGARLPGALPGAILSPLGLIVLGIALDKDSHWIVSAVGFAFLGFGITSSANVLLTYSIDCYPWHSTGIAAVINVVKSCMAFGLSYAAVPWALSSGPLKEFGTLAGIFWFCFMAILPLYLFDERIRQWSLQYIPTF
ncbi:uncharacterized protein FTJAE_9703 [Fusarium tjaetaba]|uniref:Major facilitator superfamily (MFS) profile domain-containing protein n=1 Tax=Fusarium tjaetaba TaxID=1567544 RepID=A0A8H5R3U3_9HYPO|nr:uncharacterized protein FTJAE_9703 [Fusarium tjaetaba]KAF5626322.1 hypothetical protein FTJAE_9703 [Fusarium tjaetaba]